MLNSVFSTTVISSLLSVAIPSALGSKLNMPSPDFSGTLFPQDEDPIAVGFCYHPDEKPDEQCQYCHLNIEVELNINHRFPTFESICCGHWFHDGCIIQWLPGEPSPARLNKCEHCRNLYHAVRFSGAVIQDFPGSDLPVLRKRVTYDEIVNRLLAVKQRFTKPQFGNFDGSKVFTMSPQLLRKGEAEDLREQAKAREAARNKLAQGKQWKLRCEVQAAWRAERLAKEGLGKGSKL